MNFKICSNSVVSAISNIGKIAKVVTLATALISVQAISADDSYIKIEKSGNVVSKTINLGKDKSIIIELPRNARDILIGNPEIAEVVARSARKSYVIGKKHGATNIIYFDARNKRIANITINIEPDVEALANLYYSKMPDANIHVEAMNGNIVLSGRVKSASQVGKAVAIAGKYINPGSVAGAELDTKNVINMLTYSAREQVMLKVSIVEMQRSSVKQMGIDIAAVSSVGSSIVNFSAKNPFSLGGSGSNGFTGSFTGAQGATSTVKALESVGIVRTLAEPVLTAISGESANFLAGGEYPKPTGFDAQTQQVSVDYEPFGVSLAFTPVVLDAGRISLKVSTQVSEITPEGGFAINDQITLPSVKSRKTDTTVELPSGGSLVLAGLIQENTKRTVAGIPLFKDLPILGSLFRSTEFINNETELVIIATPYLVDPTNQGDLERPDVGFKMANDFNTNFLGQINQIYGDGDASGSLNGINGNFGYVDGE